MTDTARSRYDRLHGILRDRICLLDYPPGERLSEEALAAEFGTSRTPLRRVLARLEDEGLVRSVHGVGTLVTEVSRDRLAQLYRLRQELAGLCGRLDPRPPGPDTLAGLRDLAVEIAALPTPADPRRFAELNLAFFRARLALTWNGPLRDTSERLYMQTTRNWIAGIGALDLAEETDAFQREAAEVMAALELGDLEGAAHIQRAHISMSFSRLSRRFPSGSGSPDGHPRRSG